MTVGSARAGPCEHGHGSYGRRAVATAEWAAMQISVAGKGLTSYRYSCIMNMPLHGCRLLVQETLRMLQLVSYMTRLCCAGYYGGKQIAQYADSTPHAPSSYRQPCPCPCLKNLYLRSRSEIKAL